MTDKHPEQIPMAGGKAASSKGPAFHLIPTVAMVGLAERLELGVIRKGDKAWNATSHNQEILVNKEFLIERCSHIIHHAMKLRDQLAHGEQPGEETIKDNAGAISWGGAFMLCAADALKKESEELAEKKMQSLVTLERDKQYVCQNGRLTGKIRPIGLSFHGMIPDVGWDYKGNPHKINKSLTTAELSGYTIISEEKTDGK